jgi:branched-chain amino acid transport system substrate-binding protein
MDSDPTQSKQRPAASRRHWLLGGAATLASLASVGGLGLTGCASKGPLKIGFLGGMSGRVADLGIGGRNGTQLAVDECNAAGGVGGRQLELLIQDDEQNDATALKRLTEMLDAGALLIIGPMTSAVAVAVTPLANARGVPLISPTSTTHELSGKADMFFRVVPDAPTGARQQAAFLLKRGVRRLVTLTDLKNRAFAQSWTQAAAAHFSAGGGTVARSIDFEAAPGLRFTELASRALEAAPDVLVIAASAADSALLAQQVRNLDAKVLLALSSWAGTEQLPQLGGRAVEGAIVAQYFDRGSTAQAYQTFVERFRQRFGEAPGYPAVNAYDATQLGLAALRGGGERGVAQALKGLRQHQGLQRAIDIDEFGDSRAPMFLTEVKGGNYRPLAQP